MKQRIITALLMAPLAICAVLFLPSPAFLALWAAILLAGLWEWTRLVGMRKREQRALVVLAHALLMSALAWAGWPQWFVPITVIGGIWWLVASAWLLFAYHFGEADNRRNRMIKLLAGSLAVIPAWCALALLHAAPGDGPVWALFSVMLVWVADTGAYFSGRHFGGAKLAPVISPKKTWAGFFGGIAGSLLFALLASFVLDMDQQRWPTLLLITGLATVASVMGDLFESLLKRHSGAKDSGAVIPGHGGIMDRLDSVVAAVPVFALGRWLLSL